MVPEYLGSALNFLNDRDRVATADPGLTHARLEQASPPAGSASWPTPPPSTATASWSPANGAATAWRSYDLAPMAGQLVLGGRPRPQRTLCLRGQDVYELEFARFEAKPSRTSRRRR